MGDYPGYLIKQNRQDEKLKVFWKEKKSGRFHPAGRRGGMDDDQLPLYRTY